MAINEYTELTIPEGTVQKIEDANGNIIWGSQTTFPYRKLEYIRLNGAEYLWSQITTKTGYYRRLDFDFERNDIRQCTIACYDTQSSSNNNRRYYVADFQPGTSGIRFCIGNSWSATVAMSNVPINTKLSIIGRNYLSGSTNKLDYSLKNLISNTFIIPESTLTGTTETLTAIQPYLGGCRTRKSDGTSVLENPLYGKIYYYEERSNTSQGTLTHQRYPAQRKSDGKCGLYDVITGQFEVMYGTDIYETAAGPTIDEYWNLT